MKFDTDAENDGRHETLHFILPIPSGIPELRKALLSRPNVRNGTWWQSVGLITFSQLGCNVLNTS